MPQLIIEVVGDTSQLERSFRRGSQSAEKFNRDLGKTVRGAVVGSGAFRGLGRSIAFASSAFLGGAGLAAAARSAFDEMTAAQKASAQTAAVLKSTGGAAGVTAKQVDTLAQNLLNLSGVDDEVIKGAENVLLTFTNIRNEQGKNNDIFTQATKTALDLSVALGQDLQNSAIQLGKALNNPVNGLSALQRVGVQFSDSQKTLIKNLVATGNTLEAQKVILRELQKEFGGSAKAAGETFGGQLAKLHQTILNLEGAIAKQLEPQIEQIVKRFQKWLDNSKNQKAVLDDVKAATGALADTAKVLKGALDGLNAVTGSTKHSLELLLGAFVAFKTAKIVGTLTTIASNVGLIGGSAEKSAGKVAVLQRSLLNLKALGLITLGIELDIHSKALDSATKTVLNKLGLGFLGGAATFDLRDLVKDIAGRKGPQASQAFQSSAVAQSIAASFGGLVPTLTGPARGTSGRLNLPNAVTGSVQTTAPTLTAAQQRAIGLAGNATLEALRAQKAFDEKQLKRLKDLFDAGKISAKDYTKQVVDLKDQLASLGDQINSLTKQQKKLNDQTKIPGNVRGSAAFSRIPNRITGAVSGLRPFNIPQRVTGSVQALADSFTSSPRLQLAQARAEALGQDLTPILQKMRKAAQKALKSGKLAIQGQIDALNLIAGINDQLKNQSQGDMTKFRHLAIGKQLQQTPGLTLDQRRHLATTFAQVGAGGLVPQQSKAFSGAGATTIQANLVVDGKTLATVTKKADRKAATRRVTARRGPWAGRT